MRIPHADGALARPEWIHLLPVRASRPRTGRVGRGGRALRGRLRVARAAPSPLRPRRLVGVPPRLLDQARPVAEAGDGVLPRAPCHAAGLPAGGHPEPGAAPLPRPLGRLSTARLAVEVIGRSPAARPCPDAPVYSCRRASAGWGTAASPCEARSKAPPRSSCAAAIRAELRAGPAELHPGAAQVPKLPRQVVEAPGFGRGRWLCAAQGTARPAASPRPLPAHSAGARSRR
jgi:hypothetical protein